MSVPPLSILYVDDQPLLLEATKAYLESFEFIVDTAESGKEALQKITDNNYDAIVSDYQMPVMDGIELLKEIRSMNLDIPFILFTGRGREEVVIQAIDNGADFYVQKGGKPAPQFKELSHKIRIAVDRRRDSRTIRENELRFRSLIQNSSDIIRILSKDGIIIFDSPSSERILGYPAGSLIGSRAFDFIHPDDQERVRMDFHDVYDKTSDHIPTEYRMRKADGSYLYVESIALNLIGVSGIDGIVTTTHPIHNQKMIELELRKTADDLAAAYEELTSSDEELRENYDELKKRELALIESEERFRNMAERSSDLIIIIDKNFRPSYVSPSCRSIIGYEPEDLLGTSSDYAAKTIFSPSGPEFLHYVQKNLKGESFSNQEIQILKKDGPTAFVSMSAVPTLHDGVVTGVQISIRDISATKEIEMSLRESETQYRLLADNVHDVIWTADEYKRMTYVSPSVTSLFGYTPEEFMSLPSHEYLTPESYQKLQHAHIGWEQMMKNGDILPEEISMELEFSSKNGNIVWTEIRVTPMYEPDKGFVGVVGITRDITERKSAEVSLRIANQQLGLLTSVTRHDILNKLSVIYSYLNLSEREYSSPKLAEYLRIIKTVTEEIQDHIEFTRIYQDLGTHEPQWYVLEKNIPRSYAPITITLTSDLSDIFVYADPMLEKVFFNLLDNSIRHGKWVSEIRVMIQESESGLTIIWQDNGEGIADDEKESIFEYGVGKNTGFGMFLVREILLLTGITIRETGTWNTGARFEILVPHGVYRRN